MLADVHDCTISETVIKNHVLLMARSERDWLSRGGRLRGRSDDRQLTAAISRSFHHIMVGQTSMLQSCIPAKTIDHMLTQMTTSKWEFYED